MSFYLGPHLPRHSLRSVDELTTAAAGGVLAETAWVELKEAVPEGPGANLELARDLASLSVDGGTLLIGVSDQHALVGVEDAVPVRDRVVQVAAGRCSPPVFVETHTIDLPGRDGRSVLVVSVPASPVAPHMVDGRYWARNDLGKQRLDDSRVAELFSRRRFAVSTLRQDLAALSDDLDPFDVDNRSHGHLYVLAKPVGPATGRLTDHLAPGDVAGFVRRALSACPTPWPPFSDPPTTRVAHPEGLCLADGPQVWDETYTERLLFGDDGSVALMYGRGTFETNEHEESTQVVSLGMVLSSLHCMAVLAGRVGQDVMSYWGQWEIGVRLDRLRGATSWGSHGRYGRTQFYQFDAFVDVAAASTRGLLEHPQNTVADLTRRLVRATGDDTLLPYDDFADLQSRASSH